MIHTNIATFVRTRCITERAKEMTFPTQLTHTPTHPPIHHVYVCTKAFQIFSILFPFYIPICKAKQSNFSQTEILFTMEMDGISFLVPLKICSSNISFHDERSTLPG